MPSGYCTPEDVRHALQEAFRAFGDGELADEFVESAIAGETEWVQETTNRHWFNPSPPTDPDDPESILPKEPLEHTQDELSIPSSPHSDNVQMFRQGPTSRSDYPVRFAGPYTRVTTARRDVSEITELLIRDQTGSVDDWVADDSKTAGRGEDYYIQSADNTGHSRVYIHTGSLPALSDYGGAVVASYRYGRPSIPDTVRRSVALRAGAQLVIDDEAEIGIPDSGQLVGVETKAKQMRDEAKRLLKIHL